MSAYRWPRAQPSPEESAVYTGTVYGPDEFDLIELRCVCYDPRSMEYADEPCQYCKRQEAEGLQ